MALSKDQISVKQCGHNIEPVLDAAGYLPGMNVKLDADGKYTVGAGTGGQCVVLKEQSLGGMSTSDAYASQDKALAFIPCPGDEFFALALSGETIAVGDEVGYAAAGKVTQTGTGLIALEGSGGALAADTLLLVRKA